MAEPVTNLHYAANGNFGPDGEYLPGAYGFNLADVSSVSRMNALPSGVKGLVWLGQGNGVDSNFIETVSHYIGNPNLYGFFLADEADPSQVSASNLMAESDWIHANVPGAKTFIVVDNIGSDSNPIFAFNPANTHIDLFGLDPYPVKETYSSYPGSANYSIIGTAVDAAVAQGIPLAAIVPVYQAFGGGGYSHWIVPTASQEQTILATWGAYVPNPAFDYAYSWGVQHNDTALSTDPELQRVFAAHNGLSSTTATGNTAAATSIADAAIDWSITAQAANDYHTVTGQWWGGSYDWLMAWDAAYRGTAVADWHS